MRTPFLKKRGEGEDEVRVSGNRRDGVITITAHKDGEEFAAARIDEPELARLKGSTNTIEITVAVPGSKFGIARMSIRSGATADDLAYFLSVVHGKLKELAKTETEVGAVLNRVLA